jgi:transposase
MSVQVLHDRCAGLDVHKQTVVACVLVSEPAAPDGQRQAVRTFGTMTADLERLAAWLAAEGVTHVAMEATGAYWKPVYNVLEAHILPDGARFTLLVVNAEHVHAVPGRKTDVKDAEWLATLLRHGLVRASFIPDQAQRELRELTRYRTALLHERADEANRLQKTLEMANVKLASVLTDVTGVSGQRILQALLQGEADPPAVAAVAHPRVLARKRVALEQAVVGRLTPTLAFVVRQQLAHLAQLDELITACDAEVEALTRPFAPELAALRTIPGIGPRTAEVLLAEMGADMTRFPTHRHLAAWAGMCPGNKESAGKRRPAKTRKGSPWLRTALVQAGWAASHCKAGYLPAQFRRLATRRGAKRAVVAVGHSILVIAYYVLRDGAPYEDLGGTYFDERAREAVCRRSVKRLEALGYRVHLEPTPTTAPAS